MAEVIDQPTEQRKKPRGPGKRFTKGQSGNPSGKAKPKLPPEPPMPEGLATREETQLEAMRCVLTNEKPETVQQWRMSRWYLTDQKAFMAAKASLESAELRQARGPVERISGLPTSETALTGSVTGLSGPTKLPLSVEDLGTDQVLALAGELIARLAEGA